MIQHVIQLVQHNFSKPSDPAVSACILESKPCARRWDHFSSVDRPHIAAFLTCRPMGTVISQINVGNLHIFTTMVGCATSKLHNCWRCCCPLNVPDDNFVNLNQGWFLYYYNKNCFRNHISYIQMRTTHECKRF